MATHISTIPALIEALRKIVTFNAATALRYQAHGAARIFSTHPDRFADVGVKDYKDAPTMRRVRLAVSPILTEGVEDLQNGFGDWRTILETDSDAVLNVPVRTTSGEAVGQLNLMGRSGDFPPDIRDRIQGIVNQAADCFIETAGQEPVPCR
ncbi:hypothetical protein [uncultured Pseudosulfitobacter sp.]|uniref:hypothetical protein n=1 Tax=uncultured Pseudosulfitobacter sp. TaxID=2854214 RepID=UPI0030D96132|tara:strand:- start:22715 stop:23170 length:456 start_codon:yes stop_codon:yes gene_type:complete